ncbi:choline/Carnitine O-acyltransferase [Thraustotheca clavata]|uniref:Choline/Carnitine O-acyltransferase n=1 Tax=Thraustotheca clavata TaxID=74557 RepID=A0A1W0A7Z1_9STRA|nr:choline/Carnitine O-acyltransferase [Thraustotheca clavata]
MAEANAAVHVYEGNRRGVKLLVSEEGGIEVHFMIPPPKELQARAIRYGYHLQRVVQKYVYPAPPTVALLVVAVVIAIVLASPPDSWWRDSSLSWAVWYIGNAIVPFSSYLPHSLYIAYLAAWAALAGLIVLMSVHRLILRVLLSYRGWIYLGPGEKSRVVMLWAGIVKVVGGKDPLTYSYQSALPRMSVPALKDTIERYLKSVHPLMDEEEYNKMVALAKEFETTEGPRMQKYLVLKSWFADNYITDWWEKYVYLKGRTSLMINSNYYVLPPRTHIPTNNQLARAAGMLRQLMVFKQNLDREQLPPLMLRGIVPMCMAQYERIFCTTRTPGREQDGLERFVSSKHIGVNYRGRWFKMPLYRKGTYGQLLSAYDMERQLQSIVAATTGNVPEAHLSALTAADRTAWANHRDTFFSDGINKKSLSVIESAIMVLYLDDSCPNEMAELGRSLIHGNGANRWFDKSLTLVVFANGRCGMNVEHAWADAPVVAHLWEEVCTREVIDQMYDANGHCKKPSNALDQLPPCKLLQWDWTKALDDAVETELATAKAAIASFDLAVISHTAYGKGAITKKYKMSPDAYMQMALQYAYYKNSNGTFTQTYEASMTRLYKHGRTETVRPVTDASKAFILALADSTKTNAERRKLAYAAAEAHQDLYRRAMCGEGVDRHLFTLYCVSVGMGIESPFLKEALQRPWRLSTSQQPQQQTDNWKTVAQLLDPKAYEGMVCPGGGFGPVAKDGYGVSYMIAGDSNMFFHISSDKSAGMTSSSAFAKDLHAALAEMSNVFEIE